MKEGNAETASVDREAACCPAAAEKMPGTALTARGRTGPAARSAGLLWCIPRHPGFRTHGPEHHFMVPAVVLTALRNSGFPLRYEEFSTAIQRGQTIGGGIAVSLLLEGTPYDGDKRQPAQQATHRALGAIASFNAPRCCQRDSWLALREASALIRELAGIPLTADPFACGQHRRNRECIHEQCPLWPANR